ncbi:MAG: urease accessory protein UreF [Elainellaceae cyanobacterium]
MDIPTLTNSSSPSSSLLYLLQLASPTLPVGAYSYSEGLELLSQTGTLSTHHELVHWLSHEMKYGAIRIEAAVLRRAYDSAVAQDMGRLKDWNAWLSAVRETEELRQQSWQMGRALSRLLADVQPDMQPMLNACGEPCNFAIAFAVAAAHWNIDCYSSLFGYLHSWASNLVNAGVRLIPLGQTIGQTVLMQLYPHLEQIVDEILVLADDDLKSCGWGVAIASMNHETLYSRLFRS